MVVSLAILTLALLPGRAPGQAGGAPAAKKPQAEKSEPTKGATTKGQGDVPAAKDDGAPPAAGDPAAQEGVVDAANARKTSRVEVFRDPKTENLLDPAQFKQVPFRGTPPREETIIAMARGEISLDRDAIQNWIGAQAAALTNHTNLNAWLNQEPQEKIDPKARAANEAADNLTGPLATAIAAGNSAFRQAYAQVLQDTARKNLLNNHLLPRDVAMTALGMAGDPDLVPLYIDQLKDPDQILYVKLWAARGLTLATSGGRNDLSGQRSIAAGRALADFLENNEDAHWWVKYRALEALGALRFASDPAGGKAEMASAALKLLSDPAQRPYVRAWAAWALGMMRTDQVSRYNIPLVVYHIAQAACDLGERTARLAVDRPEEASKLAGLLLYQVGAAFRGEDGLRNSGLSNAANLGNAQKFVQEVSGRVQAIASAAFNATTTSKRQVPARRDELLARVADLRAYLAKNPPGDRHLVPGGPEFPGPPEKVAEKDGK